MKEDTAYAIAGAAVLGGALWWYVRSRAPAPPPPPPAVDDGPDGIADFLGVSQICVDLAKAHPQAGGICAGLEGALAVFRKAAQLFKTCDGAVPSAEELVRTEALNRSLNGPCRAMTDTGAWINCPATRTAELRQVSPSSPGNKTAAGICVSYVNGCAPLTFAPARSACKGGTKLYGWGIQTPELTGRAWKEYQDCLTPPRGQVDTSRPHVNTNRPGVSTPTGSRYRCSKPGGASAPVGQERFPAPYGGWLWGGNAPTRTAPPGPVRDHRTVK